MHTVQLQPLRITYTDACKILAITREGLRLIMLNDPTFPKAQKTSQNRQAKVYFDYSDLINWYNSQKQTTA